MVNVKDVNAIVTTKNKTPMDTFEATLTKSVKALGEGMPKNMEPKRLMRIFIALIKQNAMLQKCTPNSLLAAIFQMGQLGLEPFDGQAYIIPYKDQAQFQIGFKGYVTLFYRHQSSQVLSWGVVKKNDKFSFDMGENKLSHSWDVSAERDEAIAYWVKATLNNGGSVFAVMSKAEVTAHAKQHSKAYSSNYTPWKTDFDSMALKTVLIQLMKLLPKSVEIMKAIDMDETIKTSTSKDMTDVPDETPWGEGAVEAEVVESPGQLKIEETAQGKDGAAVDPKTGKVV